VRNARSARDILHNSSSRTTRRWTGRLTIPHGNCVSGGTATWLSEGGGYDAVFLGAGHGGVVEGRAGPACGGGDGDA